MIGQPAVDMLLFVDDQATLSNSASSLQMVIYSLRLIYNDIGLQICTLKTKVMGFIDLILYEDKLLYMVLFWRKSGNFEYFDYSVCYTYYKE